MLKFINKQDINGNTALHIFSDNQAERCIKILLEHNAKIDITNNKNEMVRDYINRTLNYMNLGLPFEAPQAIDSLGNIRLENNLLQSRDLSFLNPYQQSLNKYGTYPTSVITPHRITAYTSESAMNVVQSSSEIMDKLAELAKAFENEVISKDNDRRELGGIVGKVEQDLEMFKSDIKNILSSLLKDTIVVEFRNEGDENNDLIKTEVEATIEVQNQLKELESEFLLKSGKLKRTLEHSQSYHLKSYIEREEMNILKKEEEFPLNDHDNEEEEDDERTVKLAIRLAELQLKRKSMVNSLVNMMAQGDETRERINKYRRLLATLSNIPLSEIDDSLPGLEESLRLDLRS